jgi:eukaryotic-like serine/threonine-protein kinase
MGRGTKVGRYVLLDRVGEGGIGVVFAANDPELDRKVAVKLLRPRSSRVRWGDPTLVLADQPTIDAENESAPDDDARARLVREAQAMARLTHPNVVAIHDVGTVGKDGVFIAMEFVEGRNAKVWLREKSRSWQEVLAVFLEAGRGLAAAHAANLVHRDFKPDNVLVGNDGRVRVTDFGLARATQPGRDRGPLAARLTATDMVLGTPGYIAPEQLRGEGTDARADQFSFCVSLYEALYGDKPFVGANLESYAEHVKYDDVSPGANPKSVPPRLRRILLKGLSRRPEHRYPSMAALLDQLGRKPELTRLRWAIFVAAAVTLGIGALAVTRLRKPSPPGCEEASSFLAGIWDPPVRDRIHAAFSATGAPYSEDAWTRVEKALDGDATRWIAEREAACTATRVRHEQTEERMLLRMACLERRRTEISALVDVLAHADEAVVAKAAEAVASLPAASICANTKVSVADLPAAAPPPEVARASELRARLAQAKALADAGSYKLALDAVNAVAASTPPGTRTLDPETRLLRGVLYEKTGEFKEAENSLVSAYTTALAASQDPVAARAASRLVRVVGYFEARVDEGRRWAEVAQSVIDRLGGDAELEGELANWRTALDKQAGQFALELADAQKALDLRRKTLGADHPDTLRALENLAIAYADTGDFEDAAASSHQAAEGTEKALGPRHPELALSLGNYAEALDSLGRHTEALAAARRAVEIDLRALGDHHPDTAYSMALVAHVSRGSGDVATALEWAKKAVAAYEKSTARDSADLCVGLDEVGLAELASGHEREALHTLERSIALHDRLVGPENADVHDALDGAGRAYLELGQPKKAVPLLERALRLRQQRPTAKGQAGLTGFALARAVWDGAKDLKRARLLAVQAKKDLSGVPAYTTTVAQIDEWLRQHPGR